MKCNFQGHGLPTDLLLDFVFPSQACPRSLLRQMAALTTKQDSSHVMHWLFWALGTLVLAGKSLEGFSLLGQGWTQQRVLLQATRRHSSEWGCAAQSLPLARTVPSPGL